MAQLARRCDGEKDGAAPAPPPLCVNMAPSSRPSSRPASRRAKLRDAVDVIRTSRAAAAIASAPIASRGAATSSRLSTTGFTPRVIIPAATAATAATPASGLDGSIRGRERSSSEKTTMGRWASASCAVPQ